MDDLDPSCPVLVVRFNRGTVGIVRSLGRLGVPVYGVASDTAAPGLASRYLREVFLHDFETAPEDASMALLRRIAVRLGRPAILIPTSDRTAVFVARHAGELSGSYLFQAVSTDLLGRLTNRRQLHELALGHNVLTPRAAFPDSAEHALSQARTIGFPLILKSIAGDLPNGARLELVASEDELRASFAWCGPASNLMIQEYLPPSRSALWMVNAYLDRHSEPLAAFCGRKLRQYPPSGGAACLGECASNARLERQSLEFLRTIGYRGPVDIDWVHDHRDDSYRLLDFNPRVGSSFRLFAGKDGGDLVHVLYRDLTRQATHAGPTVRPGRRWLAEDKDFLAYLGDRRGGKLDLPGWLDSLQGVEETVWFAADDLAPFVLMCRDLFWEQAGALRRRFSRGPASRAVTAP